MKNESPSKARPLKNHIKLWRKELGITKQSLNSQIERRTQVVRTFPCEKSLEQLVTGVLIEISRGWESGRAHLKNDQN